jgi:Holliday junction resolvasome RuvABC ATP-dependent DNA helicase subunit
MFATNFPGKLPEALGGQSGRAPRVELELYNEEQLKRILLNMLDAEKIRACEESLGIVARCGRGTARPLENVTRKLATNLLASGGEKRTVNKVDIFQALIDCQMFPLGYSMAEIEVLQSLTRPMTQQVVLARFPKLDLETWRKFLGYGMGNAHVGKDNGGFVLADKGRRYLQSLNKEGFINLSKETLKELEDKRKATVSTAAVHA